MSKNSKCCVPFCRTGYAAIRQKNEEDGKRNLSLFNVPKDRELFTKWKNKIKLDRELTERDRVCEVHFKDIEIIKFDSVTLKDGSVFTSERSHFKLKPGTIPTIFPNYPSYLRTGETAKTRKSPRKRTAPERNREVQPGVVRRIDIDITDDGSLVDLNTEVVASANADINPVIDTMVKWKSIVEGEHTIYFLLDEKFNMARRVIVSDNPSSIQIYIGGVKISHDFRPENDISHILEHVLNMKVCPGAEPTVIPVCQGHLSNRAKRCFKCVNFHRRTNKQSGVNRKLSVVIKRNESLKKQVTASRSNCRKLESIESLPQVQQEIVHAFLNAKTVTNPRNNRYTRQWMYECILLKVKSLSTYKRLRERRILPLPTPGTVQNYIRKLRASFGFQPKVFELLRHKAHSMDPRQRRGVLLLDEMKLAPSIKFDKNKLEFIGFTDIGKYTPEEQKDKPGDHALVILFQPFQGSWIQAIGAFLSLNAASGHVLSQIILEAVVSVENSGFYVDCVTTDGASWNRNMWIRFGVTEEKPYCEHMMDDTRRLYFVSDFCHLIKNLWQWIVNKRFIVTPDGVIQLSYWAAIVKFEAVKPIKAYAALNESHVHPKHFEKMNVGRAYQFFSMETASAMEFYKNRPEMKGSESTVKFIKRIANLIHAFSSRNGKSALRKYDTPERNVICDFIEYLKECKHLCSEIGMKGLKVTCAVAIELSDYLLFQQNYDFVMLTRLNQDNLERFFGMVRAFCGNNDHPDPQMFLLIFRLMTVYSLVKPAVGSNVTGDELFTTLIHDSELENDNDSNQNRWRRIHATLSNAAEDLRNVNIGGNTALTEDQRLLEFLAGYVGMKASKVRQCAECAHTLSMPKSLYHRSSTADSTPSLIELRDYHGALHYPTDSLFHLVMMLEENVCAVIGKNVTEIQPDTFFQISERLERLQQMPRVGCEEHKISLSGYVTQFYLVLRMHFAAKAVNKSMRDCKKAAELRKMGKLVQGPGKSNVTARTLVQKMDSYAKTIEDVLVNIETEINEENPAPTPDPEQELKPGTKCKPVGPRPRRSRISGEVLALKVESYAQTIEEVIANINL